MCQFSKSSTNLYPININKKNSGPFYFIHSDVLYAPLLFIVTVTLLPLPMHMGTSHEFKRRDSTYVQNIS